MINAAHRDEGVHGLSDSTLAALLTATVWIAAWFGLASNAALPSGADPGNMLAQSYSFDDASRELNYAPLLPWLMSGIRHQTGDLEALAAWTKTLGVALLSFQAVGLGLLARAYGGARAGLIGYTLTLASPFAWTQLGWGGYAQFLGVGFGGLALSGLVMASQTREGRRNAAWSAVAGLAFGLVTLSHVYSVPFFAAACLVVAARARLSPVRSGLPFVMTALVVSFPHWPTLWRIMGLGGSLRASGGDLADALIPISDALQNVTFHPATSALAFAPFLAACFFSVSRARLIDAQTLLPWIAGAAVLGPLTPPLQMDRLFLIASHALTLAIAGSLSRLPQRRFGRALIGLWALTSIAATMDETEAWARQGGRLSIGEAELLRRAGGETVAIATDSPSVEGYWFRGLTGGRALIGDNFKWFAGSWEREESALVQNFLLGDFALLGGPLSIVAPSPNAAEATLVFDDGVEFCPLFRLRVLAGGTTVTRTSDGIELHAAEETRLSIKSVNGSRLIGVTPSGNGAALIWEFRYAPYRPRGLRRTVLLKGASVEASGTGLTLTFRDRITISGRSPSSAGGRAVWTLDEIEKVGATRFVVSSAFWPRFESDPRFAVVDSAGRLRVFTFLNSPRGQAPRSLELSPSAAPAPIPRPLR